jgi:hypothetical protein
MQDYMYRFTKSHKKRGQDYERDVAKPKFFAPLKNLEPRLNGALVHYHGVI